MGLREWIRKRMADTVDDEGDSPPVASLVYSVLGNDEEAHHALETYPGQLANVLRRRQDVAAELMRMGIGSPAVRREAIPRLRDLLRKYPHPLAYEALIRGPRNSPLHMPNALFNAANNPQLRRELEIFH